MRHHGWMALLVLSCSSSHRTQVDGPLTDGPPADGPPIDAGIDAPAPDANLAAFSCRELVERAAALAPTLDRTCLDRRGCALVGYPTTCDCGPSLSQGSGWALSVTGAASPELEALDHEYESRCHQCTGDDPCVCDAFPALLSCDSGRCTATPRSCLNFGPYCAAAVY